jgi:hypothetical protein
MLQILARSWEVVKIVLQGNHLFGLAGDITRLVIILGISPRLMNMSEHLNGLLRVDESADISTESS